MCTTTKGFFPKNYHVVSDSDSKHPTSCQKTPFWKWKIKMLLPKPPKYLRPIPSRTYEIPVSPMTTEHFKFLTFRLRVLSATQKIKNRSIFQKPDGPLFWPIFTFLWPPYRVFPETFCSENFVGGLCTPWSSKPYNSRWDWNNFLETAAKLV